MRFVKAVFAFATVCLAALSPAYAQESVPASPSTPPSAVYTFNAPFFAATDRGDLADFLEYRFLITEGKANIWRRKQETGLDYEGAVEGIARADYDREVSRRKPQIDALIASRRVVVMKAQAVRVLMVASPDMRAFNRFEWKGAANYLARGTALMPVRLVELLDGPGKGQTVWMAGTFAFRQESGVLSSMVTYPFPLRAITQTPPPSSY